ncbi:MAG: hypothetical protein M3406_14770, partial [Chloroflexota bacterium]|nr:hypothetical protein [Chloroflexota bacterium]
MSNRPPNGPDIEGPLREWLHAEALRGQAAPAALRERVNAIPTSAPDRTWGWMRFGSFQSLPAVAATVVIAVTLTAVGLGLVRPFLATPPNEPPIPSASVSSVAPSAPESIAPSSPVPSATAQPSEAALAAWDVALMPDPAPGYRGALPTEVVATGQGLVAVGGAGPCCADVSYTDAWQAFVWHSPDGAVWQVIEQPEQWDKLQFRSVAWN